MVYLDGSIHPGRNENIAGAHTVGHNSDSIGVCYIGGGVDSNMNAKDTRTENQKIALRNLVNELLKNIQMQQCMDTMNSQLKHVQVLMLRPNYN